jgi:hypothetical protein
MRKSKFKADLSKEELLSKYLDEFYLKKFDDSEYSIQRENGLDLQYRGVDLTLYDNNNKFYVDEKAQLDYINNSLPTFAFELSYLKDNQWRKGWLFDKTKITDVYFLVTNIYTNISNDLSSGLSHIKITGIYRDKLIKLLHVKGLTEFVLFDLENKIRKFGKHGKVELKKLDPKFEGQLYYSKNNKNEQPINLVLKLDFLTENKTGKIIFSF